mgnify:FL=1
MTKDEKKKLREQRKAMEASNKRMQKLADDAAKERRKRGQIGGIDSGSNYGGTTTDRNGVVWHIG